MAYALTVGNSKNHSNDYSIKWGDNELGSASEKITWSVSLAGSVVGLASTSFAPGPNTSNSVAQVVMATTYMDTAPRWTPAGPTDLSFYAVLVHEIGHTLGLAHVDVKGSLQIMNPVIAADRLQDGDVAGIQALYGQKVWTNGVDNIDLSRIDAGMTIRARGGDDRVTGSALDDAIYSGFGDDIVNASGGADLIIDTLGSNVLNGEGSDDVIIGGRGQTVGTGGQGDDILIGGSADDDVAGGIGNDTIRGDAESGFFFVAMTS